jgi:hypothetical protein
LGAKYQTTKPVRANFPRLLKNLSAVLGEVPQSHALHSKIKKALADLKKHTATLKKLIK